uniref:Complex 1 LYR protein domain-containing protein n=1 Tax=Monopterus albus TaxID=43700 RepID=A0A3Q3KBP4_MONAL
FVLFLFPPLCFFYSVPRLVVFGFLCLNLVFVVVYFPKPHRGICAHISCLYVLSFFYGLFLFFPSKWIESSPLCVCVCVCYRTYALQRVRDVFRANRKVEDPKTVESLMEEGQQTLALIQRQVSIGKMYETQKTVVE